MTVLMVPKDKIAFPSLGGQVCAWIEENLVYGPGDLRGQPVRFDQEKRALIYRMYEVFPKDHPQAGRRRFKRVALSLRKGSAKTEFSAMIAAAELHSEGPVRFDGWDANGEPVGVGVGLNDYHPNRGIETVLNTLFENCHPGLNDYHPNREGWTDCD